MLFSLKGNKVGGVCLSVGLRHALWVMSPVLVLPGALCLA